VTFSTGTFSTGTFSTGTVSTVTVSIDVPFADVRGDALRWALDLPPAAALAAREVSLPDGRSISLQVLGASHQVLVRRGGDVLLSETAACDLGNAAPLPSRTRRGGYHFGSRVARYGAEAFAAEVSALVARLGEDPDALVGRFPGTPYAVTALAVRTRGSGRIDWQTWHAYPQTGELVHTTSRFDLTEDPDG
jgi:hypothetical protein